MKGIYRKAVFLVYSYRICQGILTTAELVRDKGKAAVVAFRGSDNPKMVDGFDAVRAKENMETISNLIDEFRQAMRSAGSVSQMSKVYDGVLSRLRIMETYYSTVDQLDSQPA